MAEEWDVFQMLPAGAAPVYLATLYEAYQKTIRVELNGPGAGSFAINRTSPECTEAILAQGNLVKVRIPEIDDDYIFAFFLETGDFTLISSEEAGGEMLTFGGRGILSYLEYACAWSASYITGGQDPEAGLWRAYAAGTGNKPGQILRRLIEEFQDPDRPQEPLPLLTIDFDYTNDSSIDPWGATDATAEFSYQVGEDGMAIVQRLIDTDTITVQMSPAFLLQAWNIANYGRDLTGDAFGAGVVRFQRGENIATELRRELAVLEVKTHMLAGGEADKYGTAVLADAAARVTKEGFIASFGTGTTALNGVAASELQDRLRKSDTIQFPIANRRTANVVLSSPVSVGSALGANALEGFYLPGPPGSDRGDFWVGDTVRVHTGSGQFDYTETDWRVQAITITREDDNKELTVIPELIQPEPPPPGLEPAFAELIEASYGPAGEGVVLWQRDGDDPPAGHGGTPLSGSLHYIDVGTGHTPQYQGGAHISGIGVDGYGVVDVTFTSHGFATVGWSTRDYYSAIRVNNVELVRTVETVSEGQFSWDAISVIGLAVQPGDIIEAWEGSLPGTVFLTPAGSGPDGRLIVSGFLEIP